MGVILFQGTVAWPVGGPPLPVPADVGEQVFRGGVCGGEAGEVENGLGPGPPLAFLLVRDVPLDEQGLPRVLEPGAGGRGQDADGAGLDPAPADLAGCGGGRGLPPVPRAEPWRPTAPPWGAGPCPGPRHGGGSSRGWAGWGGSPPAPGPSGNASAAGGRRSLFFCSPSGSRCCSARGAASGAGAAGSSARTAT